VVDVAMQQESAPMGGQHNNYRIALMYRENIGDIKQMWHTQSNKIDVPCVRHELHLRAGW
jgi:hypothetical protein